MQHALNWSASSSFVSLALGVCCCAGACALQLNLHDQMPELQPNIDTQFQSSVTVTEVSGVFCLWLHLVASLL